MKFLPQLLLASALFSAVLCGRIIPWGDPTMTNPNSKTISSLTLYFTLDNTLPAGHLLRVGFPLTASPSIASVTVKNTAGTSVTASSTTYSSGSAGFWNVHFFFTSDLAKATPYTMKITFSSSPQDSAGFLGFIQMETLSPADSIVFPSGGFTDTAITYDINNAFAPINIFQTPSTGGTFSTTSSDANAGNAAATYVRTFSVKPNSDILFPSILTISWDSAPTATTTSCASVSSGISTTNATAFTSSQFTCTMTSNSMTISLNQAWLANQTQTWSVSMTNPSPSSTTSYNSWATIMHKYNFNMTDQLSNSSFSVTGATVTTYAVSTTKILLSWGIDPVGQTAAATAGSNWTSTHKNIFKIYASPTGTMRVYQGLRFVFGTNATLPTLSGTATYTVSVGICTTTANCDVLENSISSTITSAACSFVAGSGTPANSISCTGISTIASSGNLISARIWIDSGTMIASATPPTTVNDSNFGVVSISSSNGAVSVSSGTVDSGYKNAALNADLLYNYNGNGPLAAVATGETTSFGNLKATTYASNTNKATQGGIFGSVTAQPMTLMLITKATQATFLSTLTTTLDAKVGLDLFLNPYLWSAPKGSITSCFIGPNPSTQTLTTATSGAATPALHCYSVTYSALYSRVRSATVASSSTPGTFNTTGGNYMTFYWESAFNLTAYSGATLQVTTQIGDHYGAFFDWVNASSQTSTLAANGSDVGELGLTTNLGTSSSDCVALANNFFFSSPTLAPVASIANYGSGRKIWIGGTDTDTAYNSNTAGQLLRVKVTFTSGTDTYPSSGKFALFIKTPSATAIEPLGPAGTTYGAYANGTATLAQTLGVSTGTVRCFSLGGVQTCSQIRRPRASAPAAATNQIDYAQIITTDMSVTSGTSFTLSIVIKPRHDYAATQTVRLAWYVASTGMYYIDGNERVLDNSGFGAAAGVRINGACTPSNTGVAFMPSSSDVVSKSISSTTVNFQLAAANQTIYAALTNYFGGFIQCVNWDFRSTTFSFSASSIVGSDACVAYDYQSIDSTQQAWYCMFCPIGATIASTATAATFTVNNFIAPPTTSLASTSFNTIWNDNGITVERAVCTSYTPTTLWATNNVTSITSTGTILSMVGHKTTIAFTAPSGLKNAASLIIKGKTSSTGTTDDTSFPYATIGSDFQCRIVPTASVSTPSAYYACGTVTLSSPTLTINLPSSWSSTISNGTGWTVYLWGMIGSTSAAATTANFSISTNHATAGAIDASPSTANAQWPVVAGTLTFSVTNIVYQRPYANARGFIRWDFYLNSQRPFFSMDKLVFNVETLASSTVNNLTSVVKCRVTDSNHALVQKFRSCTFMPAGTQVGSGTTATVTLAPLTTLSTNSSTPTSNAELDFALNSSASAYRIYLQNLNTVANQTSVRTIYGTLYFNGNSSAASLTKASSATDFPSLTTVTSFPTNYPTLTKYWAAPNVYADLVFSIISSQATSDSNRIVITFPSYYSMGLTTRARFPYCTVNGLNTGCVVESERSLVIYGIGTTIAANTPMVIRISGVTAPYSYTVENFWIQIQSDKTDPGTVIYGSTISDLAYVSQTLSTLHVNWWTTSTSNTRTSSTMTWSFSTLSTSGIASGAVVQVIFPEFWGIGYMATPPTCTVTDAASSASYGKTQYMVGNILSVNISTTIGGGAQCILSCTGMRTMDNDTIPLLQDITLRVADGTGANITFHSGMDNVNLAYTFSKSSALNYIDWSAGTSMSGPLLVTRGTYSGVLSLSPTSSFMKTFQISTAYTGFAFYPSAFNATVGSTAAATKLGASSSLSTGLYLIGFTITDSTTYTQPGLLWVNVTTSTITLNPSVTTTITNPWVSTSSLTKSVPIMFDVTNYLPYSDIIIYAVLGTGNTNFTVSPAYITLTPANPIGWFIFSTTATASATGSNYVNYTVNGTNKAAYSIATQMQTLQISADSTNGSSVTPNFTISNVDSTSPIAKTIAFSLNNLAYATIYYVVGLPNQITADLATIQNNTGSTYNINSQNQAQYGIITQYSASSTNGLSPSSVTISNLFPSTTYTINAFAVSQYNQVSSVYTYSFTTASNGGSISRWVFNFTGTYPTSAQRQALLCSLCSLVAAPYQLVRDIHGEICGNTTAFYPTSQTNTSATGNTTFSYLPIYFAPFPVLSDSSLATITSAMANNLTTMQSALSAVAATPALNSINYESVVSSSAPILTPATTGTTGKTYAYISGLKMTDAGFIWIVLTTNTTTNTTASAIKAAGASNSTVFVGFSVQYYYPGGNTVSANFSGLSAATTYNVFMVGSNNDPSWLSSFTSVSQIAVTTQGSSTSATFAMNLGTVSMFALALIASILALF